MAVTMDTDELEHLRALVDASLPAYLVDLERLVNIDCGSYTKSGVDEVGRFVAERLAALGARVDRHPHDAFGDTIVGTLDRGGNQPGHGPGVLMIAHMDTVFEPGTAAARPFEIRGDRAFGPGVSDMKGGLLTGLYALAALREAGASSEGATGWLPVDRLVFVANPDEEIGSPSSTPIIRELAREARVALVLEGARENGDIVSTRKGMMDLRVTIRGRAAHAGVEPEKGRSAILEAAHKIVALHGLTGRWPGVTVNVGVVRGGSRPNIVADEASITLDVRAVSRAHLEDAEAAVREIVSGSTVTDVTADAEVVARWWPMERVEGSDRLVDLAVGLADALGFPLAAASTGGASDANTTAGMGVPSLDGLGPIGGLDHAPGEYVEVPSIVPRTTLLAGLIAAIGRDRTAAGWRATRGRAP
jgi:glutamate carboxypeptidase